MYKEIIRFLKVCLILFSSFLSIIYNCCADDKNITIFATSDIHGNIEAENNGILRLASVLKKEILSTGGYEKSIIIDCGDFSQGSVEASLSKGRIIFELLNCLHYDIIVPGNHDFDYGLDRLIANQREISSEVLCGNLLLSGAENPFKSWKVINKNGLKVAIIGLTYPGIEGNDIKGNFLYRTLSISDSIKRTLPEIVLEKPDLIVLAIHGGLYNSGWSLKNIVRKFPEIDIIIAGHTHEEISGKLLYNRTYFIQAGSHAQYLGKILVKLINGKKVINSSLIPVSGEKIDLEAADRIKTSLNNLRIKENKTIAYSKSRIDLTRVAMNSMLKKTKADVVIFGLSEFPKSMRGEINYKEIFSIIPYEDTIGTMTVNKDELRIILQELYSYMKKKKKYKSVLFDGFSLENIQGKIVNLKFDKQDLDKKKIVLALSSYYVEYPGNKFPEIRKIARNGISGYENTNIPIRDALIDYLAELFPLPLQKR